MKTFLSALALFPLVANASVVSIGGRDVIRIEVEDDSPYHARSLPDLSTENDRLRKRINRLEKAVRQLQDRTFNLESDVRTASANQAVQVNQGRREYSCYVKTTFKGTAFGKGTTEAEARANALRECEAKDGGFDCDDGKLKCGG